MANTLFFEDFPVGRTFECGPYAVTKEEIVEFAREFDPQPHHLDEEAAKGSMLGGLAASGFHVCAMTMRMFADHMIPLMAARGGSGSRETRWMKPVRPGDVLRLEALVRSMNAALAVVGFEPERRPFRPHLTLGRVRDEVSTRRRAEIEVEVGKVGVPATSWRTSQVTLMRSRITQQGAVYEVISTFPLRVLQQA